MKQSAARMSMDFDLWMQVAQDDPQRFEAMRQAAIDEFLATVPPERRLQLQRLQWRVDRVRERCTTPMAATIAISEMMWDAFYNLRDHYHDILGDTTDERRTRPAQPRLAKVIPFHSPPQS